MVPDIDVKGQPIRDYDPLADSKIQRKLILLRELHIAQAHGDVELRVECPAAAQKYLARQDVVAQVQVVIREVPPSIADYRDIRNFVLEAGGAGLGARHEAFEENVLRHVIGRAHAIDRIDTEILDAQRAEIGAQFEVLGLDLRYLDFPAVDLGFDDRRFSRRLVDHDLVRGLLAAMEPAAAGQQRRR